MPSSPSATATNGAFPAPQRLRQLDLDLPGRKAEYLRAVAGAALDGQLDGETLRNADPKDAIRDVQKIKGLGPFAAELIVLRGANAPDVLPRHESRLDAEITAHTGASPRSPRLGAPTEPGPPSTYVAYANSAPTRSVAPVSDSA